MKAIEARGSALIEVLPATVVLALLIGVCLTGAYLLFGRAWIQYQSEQALYCAAQGPSPLHCQTELEDTIHQFLPWGDSMVRIHSEDQHWSVEVEWQYQYFSLHVAKDLTPQQMLQPKVLQW
jgi:hypothetical protein